MGGLQGPVTLSGSEIQLSKCQDFVTGCILPVPRSLHYPWLWATSSEIVVLPSRTSGLRNRENITFCCLNPNLWFFVTVAQVH